MNVNNNVFQSSPLCTWNAKNINDIGDRLTLSITAVSMYRYLLNDQSCGRKYPSFVYF